MASDLGAALVKALTGLRESRAGPAALHKEFEAAFAALERTGISLGPIASKPLQSGGRLVVDADLTADLQGALAALAG